jgi:DNA-binding MarR family transcriptional regulator
MSKRSSDIKLFLSTIDSLKEQLETPRRLEDAKMPECTQAQLSFLSALNKQNPLSMSELAVQTGVPISTATRIVDQLISKNLVARSISKNDARVIEVDFSSSGNEINQYINKSRHTKALAMLNKLSKQEQKTFLEQLTKLGGF